MLQYLFINIIKMKMFTEEKLISPLTNDVLHLQNYDVQIEVLL